MTHQTRASTVPARRMARISSVLLVGLLSSLGGCGGVTPAPDTKGDGGTPTSPSDAGSTGHGDSTALEPGHADSRVSATVAVRPAADGEVVVIGRLGRNGVSHCTGEDPYTRTWTGVTYRVGLMPIDLPKGFDRASLKPGSLVVVRGRVPDPSKPFEAMKTEDPPIPAGASPGLCGVYQMRSDWRETPDGIVRDEPGLTPVTRLQVTSLDAWTGLSARVLEERPDEVQLTLLGIGATEIQGLDVTAHYEGCYGKPGSRETSSAITLPREGASTVGFPLVATEPPPEAMLREHVLDSVRIVGASDGVHFALSVPLHELGIEYECSARRDTEKAQPKVSRDPDWKADKDRNDAK